MTASVHSNSELLPIAYDELAARCLEKIDFMERVLKSFSGRFAEDLDQLEQGIGLKDADEVARLAHRMKGACGNTAAHELHNHVSQIEKLAREDRLEEVSPCLEGIHHAWDNFQHAVKEINSQPHGS